MRVAVPHFGREPSQGPLCFGNMEGSSRQKWPPGQWVSPPLLLWATGKRPGLRPAPRNPLSLPKVSLHWTVCPRGVLGRTGGKSGTTEQLIRSPAPRPNNFSISFLGVYIYFLSLFLLNYVPHSLPLYSFSNSVPVNSSYFIACMHSLSSLQ